MRLCAPFCALVRLCALCGLLASKFIDPTPPRGRKVLQVTVRYRQGVIRLVARTPELATEVSRLRERPEAASELCIPHLCLLLARRSVRSTSSDVSVML